MQGGEWVFSRSRFVLQAFLFSVALIGFVGAQGGGGFHFTGFDGELKLELERRDHERGYSTTSYGRLETLYRESLSLRLVGDFYHPLLLEFDLQGLAGLEQSHVKSKNYIEQETLDDHVLGFDLRARFFKEHAYPFHVYAVRSEAKTRQRFFLTGEAVTTETGFGVSANKWWMPTSLNYHRYTYDGSSDILRDERRDNLSILGSRSLESADYECRFGLNRVKFDFTDNEYDDYSLRFLMRHHTKNNDLVYTNNLRLRKMTGTIDNQNHGFESGLNWRPTKMLSWNTRAGYRYSDSGNSRSSTKNYTFTSSVNHALYQSLNSNLGVEGYRSDVYRGWLDRYGWKGGVSYRKKVAGGQVFAGYMVNSFRQVEENEATILTVQDESHQHQLGQPIFLLHKGVDFSSIIVTDASGLTLYSRFAGDYQVVSQGGRVRIDIPVGSTITAGQVILVDYSYLPLPNRKFDSLNQVTSAGFQVSQWGRINLEYLSQDQVLLQGSDTGVLEDIRSRRASLSLNHWNFRFSGEYENMDSNFFPIERHSFSLSANPRFFPDVNSSISINLYDTRFKDSDDREDGMGVNVDLSIPLGKGTIWYCQGEYRETSLRFDEGWGWRMESRLAFMYRALSFALKAQYTKERFEIAEDREFLEVTFSVSRKF